MNRPNLFIASAPRCGTTAMHVYLQQHPDIFMSTPKETHFFAPEIGAPGTIRDERQYLALFAKAGPKRWAGESSPSYLYPPETPKRIKAYSPDARIILMLRDPVDLVFSFHTHRLRHRHEDIHDFAEAFAADADRREGRRLPPCCGKKCRTHMPYRDVGLLSPGVQRYLDVFGRKQVHIILYDDFAKDTAAVYRETCRFLGVRTDFLPHFPVINETERVRRSAVFRLLRDIAEVPPQPLAAVKDALPGTVRRWLGRTLRPLYYLPGRPHVPRGSLRLQLQRVFARDVATLGTLLDRDLLTLWGYRKA